MCVDKAVPYLYKTKYFLFIFKMHPNLPLVSVICLCYNHTCFVEEALNSILLQTYENIELFIVDDASQDDSKDKINEIIAEYELKTLQNNQLLKHIRIFDNVKNMGNCASFNIALAQIKGKYIIDFATDDILLPTHIETLVNVFEKLEDNVGVIFTNAMYINEVSKHIKTHFKRNKKLQLIQKIPQGEPKGFLFREILDNYLICAPSMMIKKEVFCNKQIGILGYDDTLSYEDFDFWVRTTPNWKYVYVDTCLVKKRISNFSLSNKFYQKKDNNHQNILLKDTLKILKKAVLFCKNKQDYAALAKNTFYHLRQSFFMEDFELVNDYQNFIKVNNLSNYLPFFSKILLKMVSLLSNYNIKTNILYNFYKNNNKH